MRITDIFIKRPVLALSINLVLLIVGIKAIQSLVVQQYPRSDVSVVTVSTVYVGASAELVQGFVTTPLERAIASADGIDYLESSSSQGQSTITAHLRLNFDVNSALTQVQAKVAKVRSELPPEAEAPTIEVATGESRASAYLSFYSEELEPNQITDYLTRVVQPQISAVPGVQRAEILGARTFAMRIWLKPDRMAAMNVAPSEVSQALANNNYLAAAGSTKGDLVSVNLVTNTDLRSVDEFRNLVVKSDGTTLIRLSDIADVVLGAETYDQDVRFNGQKATFMGVWVLPNANTVDVIRGVRARLPDIQSRLPSGMKFGFPYDATAYITDALDEVIRTLLETVLIVILVIFLFIGSLRSTVVPVVAIPLSLIGACAMMLAFGFSLNLLTLLAIVLSVGLVVDDAIVMLENIERLVAEGYSPTEAALKGARELLGPIIAMTITLATVYAPIAFQGGLTGALFREFALTLSGAVFVSGFVALTLSPVMCSRLVRSPGEPSATGWWRERLPVESTSVGVRYARRVLALIERSGRALERFKALSDATFDRLRVSYERWLAIGLRHRTEIVVFAVLLSLLIPVFYLFSTKELAPREDQGFLFSIVQASPNSSIEQTTAYTEAMFDVYKSFPEYARAFQLTNPSGGFSGMGVVPWSQRSRTTLDIEGEMWGKMSGIPGVRVIVTTPSALPGGSDFPVEFVILSTADPKEMAFYADEIVKSAMQSQLFMFADTDLQYDLPQSEIVIDRDKAASLGLSLQQIGNDIGVLTGGNYINRFNIAGRSYKVIPQLKRSQRLNPEQLSDVYVSGPQGKVIPLSTVASIRDTVQPRQLNRFQQLNAAKIQGAPIPIVSIDQALTFLEEKAREILPNGYLIDYAGESRQLRTEQNALLGTLILAVILIFLVLASQFESFRDPFIILLGSVPLALAGALVFVFLDVTSLNIYSQVGLVTLVGLVAKNGILIVEFANKLQDSGVDKLSAIQQAASTRLRPVLMTSVATVVGHFPLVIASGAGAAARNSIGTVLVSGMIVGTCFTLFVVPAYYMLIAKDKGGSKRVDEPGRRNETELREAIVQ